jgi:hypothetical protein
MAVTIYGDRINFNGNGDQYVAHETSMGGIGTYCPCINANSTTYYSGDTIAGSNLRYNWTSQNVSNGNATGFIGGSSHGYPTNPTYDGGGTSLSGTWRKMGGGPSFVAYYVPAYSYTPAYTGYQWTNQLWMRIS